MLKGGYERDGQGGWKKLDTDVPMSERMKAIREKAQALADEINAEGLPCAIFVVGDGTGIRVYRETNEAEATNGNFLLARAIIDFVKELAMVKAPRSDA